MGDNIKMDLKELRRKEVAQNREPVAGFVKSVPHLQFSLRVGNFLTSIATTSFS
jgi:hypothetical protein